MSSTKSNSFDAELAEILKDKRFIFGNFGGLVRKPYIKYCNLIVLEKHKSEPNDHTCNYIGGYLGFPKYGICVDVRQGDFLAMDVHEFHSNTPISSEKKGCEYGRLSVVCYLREKMIKCS